MNPFEALGYGMMKAALDAQAQAAAAPVAAVKPKRAKHRARLPRQQRLPIEPVETDEDELEAEARHSVVAGIESELQRRRRVRDRKPSADEEALVRGSQIEPEHRSDQTDELIDSTFLS